MQTRRDQLQAYKFQNRRALAALVTGDPNVVEPPMRRLTVTTISGIMIAVLVTVGFALFGLIRPAHNDDWKKPGAVVVDDNTGAKYVVIENELHPVLNYASAVLAASNNSQAHVEHVDSGDLGDTKRGSLIGVRGLPDFVPSSSGLVSSPVTVCSRQHPGSSGDDLAIQVSVLLGSSAGARPLSGRDAVVVTTGSGSTSYLLYAGHRLAITQDRVASALHLQSAPRLQVGTALIDGVPRGPDLKAPRLPSGTASYQVGSNTPTVGQLVHSTDAGNDYVALPGGLAAINQVEAALLRTEPIGSGGSLVSPIEVTDSVALNAPSATKTWKSLESGQLAGLPSVLPTLDRTASANGGVCAVYRKGAAEPGFAVPPSEKPANPISKISETTRSQQGGADVVRVEPGHAALLKASSGSPTVFLVADSGVKFAAGTSDVLTAFGWSSSSAAAVPSQLLALIPNGPALSPSAARRPVSG